MTVAELIEHLKTFPQDLLVVYGLYSEYSLMDAGQVDVLVAQPSRPDGWVHRARPDKATQSYLMFPGN